jgi:hypothetical protein
MGDRAVNITRMTELYLQGAYSPINYYLGLLALLREGGDVDLIMGAVPEPLLRKMIAMARSQLSSGDKDPREVATTQRIIEWATRRSARAGPSRASRRALEEKPRADRRSRERGKRGNV